MANIKVTEEMIIAVLRDPQYTSERQRSLALWPTASGSHLKKFKELRKKYNIPEPEPGKRGKPMSVKVDSPPSMLRYEDIRKDDRLMKGKKRLIVLAVKEDELLLQKMDGTTYTLLRKIFNATAGEYSKVPPGDPQAGPVKTYVDPALKGLDGRKPSMTINPVFEAAVQEIEAQHKAKMEPAPCVHFTQDCNAPETDSCEECKDFKDEIKLDLEMESSADPVSPFTREPEGYIDPEWGSVEREITDSVLRHREYLDKIDQLMDLMAPIKDDSLRERTKLLAERILFLGIDGEVGA